MYRILSILIYFTFHIPFQYQIIKSHVVVKEDEIQQEQDRAQKVVETTDETPHEADQPPQIEETETEGLYL